MKLKGKKLIISMGIITLMLVSMLYKTFFNLKRVNEKDNTYFAFYNGDEKLDEMPQKGNNEKLVFDHGTCDNGATVSWNENEWAPLVKNLTKNKTKCTLYFSKQKSGVQILEQREQQEQTKEDPELIYDETEDKNLRFIGDNPNNYIDIGDKDSEGNKILWRIIGVMKNVTSLDNGEKQEDLIKIIRADSIGDYSWDTSSSDVNAGRGVNEWSQADLMKLLNPENLYTKDGDIGNSLYWNNTNGKCYTFSGNVNEDCDFHSSGINNDAKNKLAKVRWNTGTFATFDRQDWTASKLYDVEKGNIDGKQYCINNGGGNYCNDNINRTTTWDGYIGLLYPSDYGYAVGKNVREVCISKTMYDYKNDGCKESNWFIPESSYIWTITPISNPSEAHNVYVFTSDGTVGWGYASNAGIVFPVAFLKSSITISNALGTPDDPFVAS